MGATWREELADDGEDVPTPIAWAGWSDVANRQAGAPIRFDPPLERLRIARWRRGRA